LYVHIAPGASCVIGDLLRHLPQNRTHPWLLIFFFKTLNASENGYVRQLRKQLLQVHKSSFVQRFPPRLSSNDDTECDISEPIIAAIKMSLDELSTISAKQTWDSC